MKDELSMEITSSYSAETEIIEKNKKGLSISFISANDIESRICDKVMAALKNNDEKLLKKLVIELMEGYLEKKISLRYLDFIPSCLFNELALSEDENIFEFKDEFLEDVYSELSAIRWEGEEKAKKMVKKLLKKLIEDKSTADDVKKCI